MQVVPSKASHDHNLPHPLILIIDSPVKMCALYTQHKCSVHVRPRSMMGPRGEHSMWKVLRWGNGLPQAAGLRSHFANNQ